MFDTKLAACTSVDPEMFFPEGFIDPYVQQTLHTMCMQCAIWKDCYDYAINNKVEGYWAGTSTAERKRIRKREGIQAKPLDYGYKEIFQATTPEAINKRNSRKRNQT